MTNDGLGCQIMIEKALTHYNLPRSRSAVQLLCMIAAHESGGFRYLKQVGGSAVSLFQMEPITYHDVCGYCLKRDYLKGEIPSPFERMVFDMPFSAAMARVFFLRIPEALPCKPKDMAYYAKKYWNTYQGKATVDDYLNAWKFYYESGKAAAPN